LTDVPFFLFLLMCTGLYLVPMLLTNWYDRYLLPVLPLLLAMLCMNRTIALAPGAFRVLKATAACLILLGTGALSLFGTADYLAWNRARWMALADLVNSGEATPQQIDGGLEFNGVYTLTPDYQASPGKSWWWVNDDLYVIAFAPLPDRQLVKAYPFKSWLHPMENRIVVLRRTQ